MKRASLGIGLTAIVLYAGCGPAFELAPPEGFVTLSRDDTSFAQRSLTARGVVLAVRDVENEPRGPLSFWVEAIRMRLTQAGGYELRSESEVRAASGEQGHQLRFARQDDRDQYAYWITVFPRGERIVLVEAGGRSDLFEPLEPEIERAIAGVRLR